VRLLFQHIKKSIKAAADETPDAVFLLIKTVYSCDE